jgi:hypothetical protein
VLGLTGMAVRLGALALPVNGSKAAEEERTDGSKALGSERAGSKASTDVARADDWDGFEEEVSFVSAPEQQSDSEGGEAADALSSVALVPQPQGHNAALRSQDHPVTQAPVRLYE